MVSGCLDVAGVDIIFDNQWHPRVIEVNGESLCVIGIAQIQSGCDAGTCIQMRRFH